MSNPVEDTASGAHLAETESNELEISVHEDDITRSDGWTGTIDQDSKSVSVESHSLFRRTTTTS
jgi:hypothetical protein